MGLLHIYCRNGKGKTTAALGLAIRAAGCGKRVHIIQLLKGNATSELDSLKLIPNITVSRCDKNYGFTFKMDEETKEKLVLCHNRLLLDAEQLMKNDEIDVLIIDEFNAAYEYKLIDRDLAERIVLGRNEKTEVVLTGRNPDEKFIDAADYVSKIECIKHPYEKGIKARRGIEF